MLLKYLASKGAGAFDALRYWNTGFETEIFFLKQNTHMEVIVNKSILLII